MASISISGTVVCKEGTAPVTVKEFQNDNKLGSFSVIDKEYFYVKQGEERFGQFYNVEVNGKAVEIAQDRLQRGDRVGIHGQLVQREYQGKVYLTIKNARITYLEGRRDEGGSTASTDEIPF